MAVYRQIVKKAGQKIDRVVKIKVCEVRIYAETAEKCEMEFQAVQM